MKRFVPFIACVVLLTTVTLADAIHTWSNGQAIRSTDLNSNFTHVHTLMVGGGAQGTPHNLLVDADVSPSANISLGKLAGGGNLIRAWARVIGSSVTTACPGSGTADVACTLNSSSQVASVRQTSVAGEYVVFLNYIPTDDNFTAIATANGTVPASCTTSVFHVGTVHGSPGTPQFYVFCTDLAGTPTDSLFSFTVLDDN